jgi:hypothetical protein
MSCVDNSRMEDRHRSEKEFLSERGRGEGGCVKGL